MEKGKRRSPMEFVMTCTTAELMLLVGVCDYPGVAKGIGAATFGKRSEKEWKAILETAEHQLILKGIIDDEKAERGEEPISDEMKTFINRYVQSKWIIRGTDMPRKRALMFHHYEGDDWLAHIIYKDIIHEFYYVTFDEILDQIREYYSFSSGDSVPAEQFFLTEKAFDWLNEPKKVDKVKKKSEFTDEEKRSFEHFLEDLEAKNRYLYNLTTFHFPNGTDNLSPDLYMENVLYHMRDLFFFLPSQNGVWLVEYTPHPKTPVRIYLVTVKEWIQRVARFKEVIEM
jgi:hypothetical protein